MGLLWMPARLDASGCCGATKARYHDHKETGQGDEDSEILLGGSGDTREQPNYRPSQKLEAPTDSSQSHHMGQIKEW